MTKRGLVIVAVAAAVWMAGSSERTGGADVVAAGASVNRAVAQDESPRLASVVPRDGRPGAPVSGGGDEAFQRGAGAPAEPPRSPAGARVEQTEEGSKPPAVLVASFDGLGVGFEGPHGPSPGRNPSDNSLAVGPDHIVQTVNTRLAIFTKKGSRFDTTGRVLYGAVPNNTVFRGFTGTCDATNNGDTVVRYDQLANRWLIVMPIFRRAAARPDQPPDWKGGDTAYLAPPGVAGQPGAAAPLFVPPPAPPTPPAGQAAATLPGQARGRGRGQPGQPAPPPGTPPRMRTVTEYAGLTPGFVKAAPVAWFASHRHLSDGTNEPYAYSYLFAYAVDLPAGARTLTLPVNERIRILAASVTNEQHAVRPVTWLYDRLER